MTMRELPSLIHPRFAHACGQYSIDNTKVPCAVQLDVVLSLLVYAASIASTEFHMRNHLTMNNTEVLLGVHLLIYNSLPMLVYAASITYTEFHVCHLKIDLHSF